MRNAQICLWYTIQMEKNNQKSFVWLIYAHLYPYKCKNTDNNKNSSIFSRGVLPAHNKYYD